MKKKQQTLPTPPAPTQAKRKLTLNREQLKELSDRDLDFVSGGKCEMGTCDPGTWI